MREDVSAIRTEFQIRGGPLSLPQFFLTARHVDDTLIGSSQLCARCMTTLNQRALPSYVGSSCKDAGRAVHFLHLVLVTRGTKTDIFPANANIEYILGLTPFQSRARIPPALPGRGWSPAQVSQYLAGRFAVHQQVGRGAPPETLAACDAANELALWELWRLGYSLSVVRQSLAKIHPKHGLRSLTHLRSFCAFLQKCRVSDLCHGVLYSIGAISGTTSWFAGLGNPLCLSPQGAPFVDRRLA